MQKHQNVAQSIHTVSLQYMPHQNTQVVVYIRALHKYLAVNHMDPSQGGS